MNNYFLLVGFLLLSTSSYSQNIKNDSIKSFIDQSMELIEANSIHTDNLSQIKNELYQQSQNLNSIDEIAPLYKDVFKQLDDYHGALKYKGKTYGWDKPNQAANAYLKDKIKIDKGTHSLVIDEEIGYLRIPGNNDFAFKKVDSIANDIVAHINSINSDQLKGWIIDLRLNTGGNMYPILLGLKEFIGNDIVFGGFRDAQDKPSGNWEIKAGKLWIDSVVLERQTELDYPIKAELPIVILTSCYTASAGEMTAISFIGRKNTSVVGEETANYTTAVQGFKINEDAGINLSTDYVVDRNLKVYKTNISPDFEVVEGDNLEDLKKDLKIIRALELLRQ